VKKPAAVRVKNVQPAKPSQAATVKSTRPGQGIFSALGGLAGGALGGPIGGRIGSAAGDLLGSVLGFGDYEVKQNSIVNPSGASQQAPVFANNKGETRIQHREYIGDVYSAANVFATESFIINAGDTKTFPWLSTIAAGYEMYKFNGIVFVYKPTSGQVTASSPALGAVMMATAYDVLDPPFASKREIDAYEFATSCPPFSSMMHPVECAPGSGALQNMYVRNSGVTLQTDAPDVSDPRFYDMGRMQWATQGMPSGFTCGELWVTYDVTLTKPKLAPSIGALIRWACPTASGSGNCFATDPDDDYIVYNSGPQDSAAFCQLIDTRGFTITETGTYDVRLVWMTDSDTFTSNPSRPSNTALKNCTVLGGLGDATYLNKMAIMDFGVNCTKAGNGLANTIFVNGPAGADTTHSVVYFYITKCDPAKWNLDYASFPFKPSLTSRPNGLMDTQPMEDWVKPSSVNFTRR